MTPRNTQRGMSTKLTGLLWSADAPREAITVTLANAVVRFEEKFGYPPDTAYLNERQFDQAGPVAGIQLHPAKNVLKNTVWVVVREVNEKSPFCTAIIDFGYCNDR